MRPPAVFGWAIIATSQPIAWIYGTRSTMDYVFSYIGLALVVMPWGLRKIYRYMEVKTR